MNSKFMDEAEVTDLGACAKSLNFVQLGLIED